jgi:chromosome segregation and condensation protein ScpB
MEQGTLFLLTAAAIANLLILYLIINAATKATLRAKYDRAQMELLAKIARAQGVPMDEVQETLDKIK